MAQIKNIKKPGDLIRGAKVGVAGLDKDGQIVAFTASPEDAGKVLTVGEDGTIILAKASGGGTLYQHNIDIGLESSASSRKWVTFSIITSSDTPWTLDDLKAFLTGLGATSSLTAFRCSPVGIITPAAEAGSIAMLTGNLYLYEGNVVVDGKVLKTSDGSIRGYQAPYYTMKDTVLHIA